jgi:hypothetical protein
MLRLKFAIASMIATAAISGAGLQKATAQTPQASPQSYGGYASPQAPPGPGSSACYPTPGCQNVKYGCTVTVCTCPCQTNYNCQEILSKIPQIHTPPTCQEAQVCTIIDEGPPTAPPVCIPIYRNCYVPIKVVTQPGPGPNVITPVNIQVNWREVHVLCGSDGKPLSSAQTAQIIKDLSEQLARGEAPNAGQGAAPTAPHASAVNPSPSAPSQAQAVAPTQNAPVQASAPTPTPYAPVLAQATEPQKQWVWLAQEGVYGYGYQRTDGLWEIDAGSRRTTLQ